MATLWVVILVLVLDWLWVGSAHKDANTKHRLLRSDKKSHQKPKGHASNKTVAALNTSGAMDYLMLTQPQYKQDATASWAPGTSLIYLVAFCDAAYLALAAQMLRTLYHFGGYCGDVLFITEEALKASILAMPELVHFKVCVANRR